MNCKNVFVVVDYTMECPIAVFSSLNNAHFYRAKMIQDYGGDFTIYHFVLDHISNDKELYEHQI